MVRAYERARKVQGKTGEALIAELERRLDALVLRAGFARTIYQARQMVVHGHIAVNGAKVDKPSFRVRPDDVVTVRERSRGKHPFLVAREGGYATDGETPRYLEVNLPALASRWSATSSWWSSTSPADRPAPGIRYGPVPVAR